MTRQKSGRSGVSSVIGMVIMLTLMLLTVATVVSLETAYQSAITSRTQFVQDKRLENFIIIDANQNGSQVEVMNRGPIAIQIVSVYVNHYPANSLTQFNVTACQIGKTSIAPCVIPPQDSLSKGTNMAWIKTGATVPLNFGDLLTITSSRGNRASATFPVGKTGFSGSSNLYAGTGPLTIVFAPGSFNYTTTSCSTANDAWGGVPAGATVTFCILIVNHGLGDIVLQSNSVLYMTYITSSGPHPPATVAIFPLVGTANPYIIPDNPNGDLAAGGAPVLVRFGLPSTVLTQPSVVAVLIGTVYIWNGNLYSQDIPLATLVLQ